MALLKKIFSEEKSHEYLFKRCEIYCKGIDRGSNPLCILEGQDLL